MGRSESYGGVHLKRLIHNELILSKVAISLILFHEKVFNVPWLFWENHGWIRNTKCTTATIGRKN